ncbi:NAD(P)-dependent dehydrogenase (short-subunit alcohol dehydrogenase family) [Pedobacter sp. UYP30]|uniref:SDR family oxidoreductase n=1 Tax=Pedobacter sp. UYP30 TaxID=1756400 RepID=UPI00339552F4
METSKIAFITGANRGLGLEIGRQLGKLKIKVLLGARNEESGREAASQLKTEGIDAEFIPIDVTDNKSIENAASVVKRRYGKLDILINNAVFFNRENQSPSIIPPDLLHNYLNTNFIGPVLVSQAFLPLIRESSAGRIVNLSTSIGSLATMGDSVNTNPKIATATPLGYSSSKAALNMFTVLLAKELKETNIKVNSADPGLTQTDMGGKDATYTVEEGARPVVWLACLDEHGPTGGFFSHKKVNPW